MTVQYDINIYMKSVKVNEVNKIGTVRGFALNRSVA